jgi:hypothetical protein
VKSIIKVLFIIFAFYFSLLSLNALITSNSFEFVLSLKEQDRNNITLYEEKNLSMYLNDKGNLSKEIKYNDIIVKILGKIKTYELTYKGLEIYQVLTLIDSNNQKWTYSITVNGENQSVTHIISSQDQKIIEGWINRKNKDLFGLRIFNF